MSYYDTVVQAADRLRERFPEFPRSAVVLGSGLGDFAATLENAVAVPYDQIPGWPPTDVMGHEGRLVVGLAGGRPVAALCGRAHLYEGHDARTVTFPVRVLGLLGVEALMLTNAAGGISPTLSEGALMVIDDHINLTGVNPLAGPNDERFGLRFPDMSEVYSLRLRRLADDCAERARLMLRHGVYAALAGPSYETPAEIRYLRTIGADAVGMSTVPEAIVARHMGMEVLGISCITNMVAGILQRPLEHADVVATARRVRGQFHALIGGVVEQL